MAARKSKRTAPPPPPFQLLGITWLRRLVQVCALGAGGISFWLTLQKLTGKIDSIAGCGGAGGCSQVLGGPWSAWMLVPVSALSLGFYLGVLALTLRPMRVRLGTKANFLLASCAVAALLTAGWFTGVLVLAEKAFCPFCAAVHALGLAWSLTALWQWRRHRPARGAAGGTGGLGPPLLAGAAGVAVLALGQILGPKPQTFLLTTTAPPTVRPASAVQTPAPPPAPAPPAAPSLPAAEAPAPPAVAAVVPPAPEAPAAPAPPAPVPDPAPAATPPPAGRDLVFMDGTMYFRSDELPILGSKDAPHIMVEYFDYTCASCRDMSKDLAAARAQLGGQVAVIVLPCPLNRQCNPALPAQVTDHAGACGLARLSLAVWRRAPEKFEAYHHFLMSLPLPANEPAARARAAQDCGGEAALDQALADPWIEGRINQTVQEYAALCVQQIKMPKLLLHGNVMMHGTARSAAVLTATLRQQFGL